MKALRQLAIKALRHSDIPGLAIDVEGFADVRELAAELDLCHDGPVTEADVLKALNTPLLERVGERVRAVSGHTFLEYPAAEPPAVLYAPLDRRKPAGEGYGPFDGYTPVFLTRDEALAACRQRGFPGPLAGALEIDALGCYREGGGPFYLFADRWYVREAIDPQFLRGA